MSLVVAVGSAVLTAQSAAATPVSVHVAQAAAFAPSASPAAVIAAPPPPPPTPPKPAPVAQAPKAAPPKPVQPASSFVTKLIRIAQMAAPGADAQAAADRCIGPIEYRWGNIPPIVVQHNFCGGYSMVSVKLGQTVRITGGDIAGTYVVAGRHYVSAYSTMDVFQRSWGDVILATCTDNSTEVAVGLTRVG